MNFGCQSMTGKIESILLKKPEQAFISQEHLEKTWEEFKNGELKDNISDISRYDRRVITRQLVGYLDEMTRDKQS